RRENEKLIWEKNHETVTIQPWGKNSLRVKAAIYPDTNDRPWALLTPAKSAPHIEIKDTGALIRNGKITAGVSPEGRITFLKSADQSVLLEEIYPRHGAHPYPARCFKPRSSELFRLEVSFKAFEGERFYGLGQHQHGFLDQKGCIIELFQRNTEVCIPFLLSSRGYGFLWNNPSIGRVELGRTQTRWVADGSRGVDYFITAGDSYAEILGNYAEATGHAPLMPVWAQGFWQSKLRYKTQEELLSVAREYKKRHLPLSVIVADFFHWTLQGDWQFDPACWPDPGAMVRELDKMNVKLMVSIWPTVNENSRNYTTMKEHGWLVRTESGGAATRPFFDNRPPGPIFTHFYDPTNPAARRFIWEQVRENYYRKGIKVWWLDACEPELTEENEPENLRYHLGNGLEVGCLFPWANQQAFYEGMKAENETEYIMLCRSAWAGSQRYGAAVWSGDIQSTFEALQAQVRAGLNIGLSGIPWWTTDIGGFYGGHTDSPYFRELIVRWFQYGVFCPLFRLHGFREPRTPAGDLLTSETTGTANEVWSFGNRAYKIIREIILLRERLQPYIDEQMKLAHKKGIPPMRPLFFDFSRDAECAAVEDEFLFGPDILVAPVLEYKARKRRVYLPAGTGWIDAWTGKKIKGGQWIEAEAPLERVPVYLKGDSPLLNKFTV
ncbi:MAG TPA: TIM-barrel domain-containing protein, partial [Dehalococcoidales bacterium]|nr:TIM-barrel domain-containing protein [Dehalococcoidales bacterium]